MADVQMKNGYLPIARKLFDALITTNFSKRQRSIINLILRLSYGCQRKNCVIPQQRMFEVFGVDRVHIKAELDVLIKMNVITRDGMIYAIQKDYDKWEVKPAMGKLLDGLIHLNLETRNGEQLTKSLLELTKSKSTKDESYQKVNRPVYEKLTDELIKSKSEDAITIEDESENDPPITVIITDTITLEPTPAKADDEAEDPKVAKRKQLEADVDEFIEYWNELSPERENVKAVKLRGAVKGAISRTGDPLWDAANDFWFCVNSPVHNDYEPRTLAAWLSNEFYRKFLPGFNPRVNYRKKK